MDPFSEQNRRVWDEWTLLHRDSPGYDLASFKKGACTLGPIEIEEVGDVAGKSILHLQCHFGLDTLSWARRGARVTGVDFSPRAIGLAKSIRDEVGLDARFLCCDVYSLPEHLTEEFDIVFASYGVLTWLPDLRRWAQFAAARLRPGGLLFLADFHPFAMVFDDSGEAKDPRIRYPYFPREEPLRFENKGSYAAPDAPYRSVTYEWVHSMGEIVTSIADAGLSIVSLREHRCCPSKSLPGQVHGDDGWWRLAEHADSIPLLFSLRAAKPSDRR